MDVILLVLLLVLSSHPQYYYYFHSLSVFPNRQGLGSNFVVYIDLMEYRVVFSEGPWPSVAVGFISLNASGSSSHRRLNVPAYVKRADEVTDPIITRWPTLHSN